LGVGEAGNGLGVGDGQAVEGRAGARLGNVTCLGDGLFKIVSVILV
jgi:hypothetical protein